MSDQTTKVAPLLQLKHVSKIYQLGEYEIKALDKIDFTIYPHEFVAIVGSSG